MGAATRLFVVPKSIPIGRVILSSRTKLEREVEHTSTQVDRLERDVAEQRALVEALAEQEGLDVEDVLERADLPPEPTTGDESGDSTDTDSDGTTVDVTEET